jgi:hypothetical protein
LVVTLRTKFEGESEVRPVGPEVRPLVCPDVWAASGPDVGPDVGPEVGRLVTLEDGPDVGRLVGSEVGPLCWARRWRRGRTTGWA